MHGSNARPFYIIFQLLTFLRCSLALDLLTLLFSSWPSYTIPQLLTLLHCSLIFNMLALPLTHPQQLLFFSFLCSFSPIVDGDLLFKILFIVNNSCWCPFFFPFVHFHLHMLVFFFSKQRVHLLYFLFICNSCYYSSPMFFVHFH